MKTLKTGVVLAFSLMLMAYTIAFAVRNAHDMSLDFLLGQPVALPTSIWTLLLVLVGVLLGMLLGSVGVMKEKMVSRQLRKELQDVQQRLAKLP